MNLLSVAQAAESLGMSRQNFHLYILPLMQQIGQAHKAPGVKGAWGVDEDAMWEWRLYAATRRNLIAAGAWQPSRPWAISDLDDIVRLGAHLEYQPSDAWRPPSVPLVRRAPKPAEPRLHGGSRVSTHLVRRGDRFAVVVSQPGTDYPAWEDEWVIAAISKAEITFANTDGYRMTCRRNTPEEP